MSYTFVFTQKDGWWLKITNLEALIEYWKIYTDMFEASYERLPQTKEFGRGMLHADTIGTMIAFYAKSNKLLHSEAKEELLCNLKKEQYKAFLENGVIFINKEHGWNTIGRKAEQFVHRSELIFPDFVKGEIKVERFMLGHHYYVFMDGVQLRDGDCVKWNTPEEAYAFARKIKEGIHE